MKKSTYMAHGSRRRARSLRKLKAGIGESYTPSSARRIWSASCLISAASSNSSGVPNSTLLMLFAVLMCSSMISARRWQDATREPLVVESDMVEVDAGALCANDSHQKRY